MTDHVPTPLSEVLDAVAVRPAPTAALLRAGARHRRRRRQATVVGAAVAVLASAGVALAAGSVLPDGAAGPGPAASPTATSEQPSTEQPSVDLVGRYAPAGLALAERYLGAQDAVWDPATRTVYVAGRVGTSSSCPPVGRASLSDDGVLELALVEEVDPSPDPNAFCTADAVQLVAVVAPVEVRPDTVVLTEGDRPSVTIPVADVDTTDAPGSYVEVTVRDGAAAEPAPPSGVALWDQQSRSFSLVVDDLPGTLTGDEALRHVRERYGREQACRPRGRAAATGATVELVLEPSASADDDCPARTAGEIGVVATVYLLERRPTRVVLTDGDAAPVTFGVVDLP